MSARPASIVVFIGTFLLQIISYSVYAASTASELLPDLLDAEKSFLIAKRAAEEGDFQTAIIALERVLLINPDLSNIKFELGLLYGRVGAVARSRYYLTEALKDDQMPPDVRKRAESELLKMDDSLAKNQFSGHLSLSVQHDTNAGAISDFKQFVDPVLGPSSGRSIEQLEGDVSLRGTVGLNHKRWVGSTGRTTWQNNVRLQASKYRDQGSLDEQRLSFGSGLTFQLDNNPDAASRVSYSPSLLLAQSRGDGQVDDYSIGMNFRMNKSSRDYSLSSTFSAIDQHYSRSESLTRDGVRVGFDIQSRFSLTSDTSILLGYNVGSTNANADFESYTLVGFNVGVTQQYNAFSLGIPATWTARAAILERRYDGPEMLLDPEQSRDDTTAVYSLSTSIPLNRSIGINLETNYRKNNSNILNYDYDNFQVSAGFTWWFD